MRTRKPITRFNGRQGRILKGFRVNGVRAKSEANDCSITMNFREKGFYSSCTWYSFKVILTGSASREAACH
jgi:hypothetical protein